MARLVTISILVLCVSLYLRTVNGTCFICKYKTEESKCKDPYTPAAGTAESKACDLTAAQKAKLCENHTSGYRIHCEYTGGVTTCSNNCGSSGNSIRASMTVALLAAILAPLYTFVRY